MSRPWAGGSRIKTMPFWTPDGSHGSRSRLAHEWDRAWINGAGHPPGLRARTDGAWLKLERQPLELPRRVLVVEPSPSERSRLCDELTAGQLEVSGVGDAAAAAAALPIVHPDLILAQVRLPVESGLELLHRLKDDRAAR